MATFTATFSDGQQFNASFSESSAFGADFGEIQIVHNTDYYEGEYEATPSDTEQTFATQGLTMTEDFVVHAIPSNYGKITWNGAFLTVS